MRTKPTNDRIQDKKEKLQKAFEHFEHVHDIIVFCA